MSYRDDLDAAHARLAALERENQELRDKLVARDEDRPLVPVPKDFDVAEDGDALTVRWRWRRGSGVVAVMWAALTAAVVILTAVARTFSVWLVLGPLLTYLGLARALNRTTLRATADGLRISHGPFPLRRGVRVPRRELEQLYVDLIDGREQPFEFALCAVDHQGRKRTLLEGLPQRDQARWLEVELERRLGIAPRPVEGELGD
jgi:hypothetical protein